MPYGAQITGSGGQADDHPRELAALQQLAAAAAAAGHLVLRGAHRLLGAAAGLDQQQVALAASRR